MFFYKKIRLINIILSFLNLVDKNICYNFVAVYSPFLGKFM